MEGLIFFYDERKKKPQEVHTNVTESVIRELNNDRRVTVCNYAEKIALSVPTIHQIIIKKKLTFKIFVHGGCPDCCLRMENKGGLLHPASFYLKKMKKKTCHISEQNNHHG